MTKPTPTPRDKTAAAVRRRARWLRANPLCEICARVGRVTPAVELDHRLALHLGGAESEENYQSVCVPCHKEKSARERGFEPAKVIGEDGWPVNRGE